jgi:hypothetical protein
MPEFWVNGIVAQRDKQPYLQLSNEKGMIAQMSMAQARKIAMDMLVMCSRTEMDAMVIKFFSQPEFPEDAPGALLVAFRDFRAELDQEKVEGHMQDPDTGEIR